MTHVVEHVVDVVTSSDGAATVYTTAPVTGRLGHVVYDPSTASPFATGVQIAITLERTGIGLWTQAGLDAAAVKSPTAPIHDALGVARNPTSTAVATEIGGPIYAANERVKVVVASGGAAKQGTFRIVVA